MIRVHPFLVVPALLAAALVAQAGLAPPAQAAVQRYAAPAGSGTACSSTVPCALATAVNAAGSGAEVILAAGTYEVGSTNLTRPTTVTNLNVHGAVGQPRPVINTAANIGLQLLGNGARVADLTIVQTGSQWGLNVFAAGITVERVAVRTAAQVGCGLGYSGVVRDLLCVTSSTNGVAFDDTWGGGTGALTVRNLTAVAAATGSYGIRADSTSVNTNLDIDAKNVIAIGAKADIRSNETPASDATSESDVILAYSNYDSIEEGGGGNVSDVGSVSSNQTALPIFADAEGFHEAPTSPTIDRGTVDARVGTGDLDGQPRLVGAAVDIGADEFVPDTTPPDVAFDHTPKHRTRRHKARFTFHASEPVTFTCRVDKRATLPCGSPFKVKLRRRGKHQLVVVATDSSGNVDPSPATCTWRIKPRRHRYHHHQH